MAFEESPAQPPRQLIYCRFPINDGGGNDRSVLIQAVATTQGFLKLDIPTIVACSAGMSRSPTIAAFALAIHLDQSPSSIVLDIAKTKALEIKAPLWDDVANAVQ